LVAVAVDPAAGKGHVERCFDLWPPRGLVASPAAHLLRLWWPAVRRVPVRFVVGPPIPGAVRWSRATRTRSREEVFDGGLDAPALLTFTSGSTGEPRAAVRSHGLLLAQHGAVGRAVGLAAGDVCLTSLPIVLLSNLAAGVTSLIPEADLRRPGSFAPAPVVGQIWAHRPTSVIAPPAFLERLTDHCAARGLRLPTLRRLVTGGGPVFPRLLERLQATAPGADVVAVYGCTEAEPIACLTAGVLRPEDRAAVVAGRGLPAGIPVPEVRLRILPDRWGKPLGPYTEEQFADLCLPSARPGEVVVSGAHVLPGYLKGQGDEDTKVRVGGDVWHRTGDAAYLDDGGRLWLLGRCAGRVTDAEGELYPLAVEAAAHEDPAVRRAALVPHSGRRVLAIQPARGQRLDPAALARTLPWARLDEIRICRHIPVDGRHNSKVDYPGLQRMLGLDACYKPTL
jgi:olefin beta-lactone synthetase